MLEGDIGGGLVLQRHVYVPKNVANIIQIDSSIIARSVGAGSGGFSRLYLKPLLLFPYTLYLLYDRIYYILVIFTYPSNLLFQKYIWMNISRDISFFQKFHEQTVLKAWAALRQSVDNVKAYLC